MLLCCCYFMHIVVVQDRNDRRREKHVTKDCCYFAPTGRQEMEEAINPYLGNKPKSQGESLYK